MSLIAIVFGCLLVVGVIADVINTLVTTTVSRGRWWLTVMLYTATWQTIRSFGSRLSDQHKEQVYALFAPISVMGSMRAARAISMSLLGALIYLFSSLVSVKSVVGQVAQPSRVPSIALKERPPPRSGKQVSNSRGPGAIRSTRIQRGEQSKGFCAW